MLIFLDEIFTQHFVILTQGEKIQKYNKQEKIKANTKRVNLQQHKKSKSAAKKTLPPYQQDGNTVQITNRNEPKPHRPKRYSSKKIKKHNKHEKTKSNTTKINQQQETGLYPWSQLVWACMS